MPVGEASHLAPPQSSPRLAGDKKPKPQSPTRSKRGPHCHLAARENVRTLTARSLPATESDAIRSHFHQRSRGSGPQWVRDHQSKWLLECADDDGRCYLTLDLENAFNQVGPFCFLLEIGPVSLALAVLRDICCAEPCFVFEFVWRAAKSPFSHKLFALALGFAHTSLFLCPVDLADVPLDDCMICSTRQSTMVDVLASHCTFAGLVQRPTLCSFHSVDRFFRLTKTEVKQSTADELRAVRALVLVARSSWTRQWNLLVSSSDARPFGYGVSTAQWAREPFASSKERARATRGATPSRRLNGDGNAPRYVGEHETV